MCLAESELPKPVYLRAQRWASAYKADLIEDPCVTNLSLDLSTCGDFCGKASSAEGAILSGELLVPPLTMADNNSACSRSCIRLAPGYALVPHAV